MPDGRRLTVRVRVGDDRPARIALGVRKSGSSLFAQIVTALARGAGWPAVDVPGTAFEAGYGAADWYDNPRARALLWRGNAYVGFRAPPLSFYGDTVFVEAAKLLLVRDPRDALVSEFFSNRYSHRLPPGGGQVAAERERALATELDDYVVARAGMLDRTVQGYAALLDDPRLAIQRYEDVILNKRPWLHAIAAHFGWPCDEGTITTILKWADVIPATEEPTAFVRRVRPGDHRDKLSPDTLRAVRRRLSSVWRDLGYDLDG